MPIIGSTSTTVDANRQITAGTGLSGGGDLTADRSLEVQFGTSSTTVARGSDSRFGIWDLFTGTPTANGQTPVWSTSTGKFAPGTPPATMDAEQVRDIMGVALVGGTNVTVTVNDAGDTITISSSGGGTVSDATTSAKGIVQLAGDLGGTAAAPTVPNKVGTSLVLTAGTGLTGGGNLTANRTFAVAYGTTTGTALQGSLLGNPSGAASLDSAGRVPQAQLPVQNKAIAITTGPVSGNVTLDAALGSSHAVTINGNTSFFGPINAPDGFAMRIEVRNTAATAVTVSFPMTNISGVTLPISLSNSAMLIAGLYWSVREASWFLVSANWEP